MRLKGLNPATTPFASVPDEVLVNAANFALKNTFAYRGADYLGRALDYISKLHPVGQIAASIGRMTAVPFTVYMGSAATWVGERPGAIIKLFTENGRQAFRAGNVEPVTKAIEGGILVALGTLLRNSPFAGEDWDTLKLPGSDTELGKWGQRVGMMRYGPVLPPYLAIGEVLTRFNKWRQGD